MPDLPERPEEELEEDGFGGPSRELRGIPDYSPPDVASREERAREGVREARASDLRSAMAVHGRLCGQMDKACAELKAALSEARALEDRERAASPDEPRLLSSIAAAVKAAEAAEAVAVEAARRQRDREGEALRQHEAVCARMDSAARELYKAVALSALLDKSSGSGFNVEARLGRRLDVRGLQRTIQAAHSHVSKASKSSRARAGSHGRAVEELIEDVPAGFE